MTTTNEPTEKQEFEKWKKERELGNDTRALFNVEYVFDLHLSLQRANERINKLEEAKEWDDAHIDKLTYETKVLTERAEKAEEDFELGRGIALKEIDRLTSDNATLKAENESLKKELEAVTKPYWPICDVEGCQEESCNGGGCWRDTGYWSVCQRHSKMFRDGATKPTMKESAVRREKGRNSITGYLPIQKEAQ